jgi:hypothetical protein
VQIPAGMSLEQVLEAGGVWNATEEMTVELLTLGRPEPSPSMADFYSVPSHDLAYSERPPTTPVVRACSRALVTCHL